MAATPLRAEMKLNASDRELRLSMFRRTGFVQPTMMPVRSVKRRFS